MVYYMSDSNNRSRNGDRLKFTKIVSVKRRLGFLVMEVATESALASWFPCNLFQLLYFCIILFYLYFNQLLRVYLVGNKGQLGKPPLRSTRRETKTLFSFFFLHLSPMNTIFNSCKLLISCLEFTFLLVV